MLAIFFIAFTFIDYGEAKGQPSCPTGYTSTSFTYFYDNDPECIVTVFYCYKPWMLGILEITGYTIVFDPNGNCERDLDFSSPLLWEELRELIISDATYKNYQSYPPCDGVISPTQQIHFSQAQCVQYQNVAFGLWGNELTLEPCEDSGYCIYVYDICYDFAIGHPRADLVDIHQDFLNCETVMTSTSLPPHPWNGDPAGWNFNWTSPCFILSCDPIE